MKGCVRLRVVDYIQVRATSGDESNGPIKSNLN